MSMSLSSAPTLTGTTSLPPTPVESPRYSPFNTSFFSTCNPDSAPGGLADLHDPPLQGPFCVRSWPVAIANLSQCCDEGAEVHVYRNCTQYCLRADKDVGKWQECVLGLNQGVYDESEFRQGIWGCEGAATALSVTRMGWLVGLLTVSAAGYLW